MELKFLGTSSGSPTLHRNVSATAVCFERTKSWCLVDCGEGTQHQMMKFGLPAYHLSVIAVTHLHGDHCYGLPGLLAAIMVSGRNEPVCLVAPKKIVELVRHTLELTELQLSYDLITYAIEDVKGSLEFPFFTLDILTLKHRVPSYGFKFTEKLIPRKLRLDKLKHEGIPTGSHLNTMQKGLDVVFNNVLLKADDYTFLSWKPRVVILCGDNEKPSMLSKMVADIDVLVHEATFTHRDLKKIGTHTGHSDALRIAKYAQSVQLNTLILTHFSVRYHGEGMLASLLEEASTFYNGELLLAFDGMSYVIAKQFNE